MDFSAGNTSLWHGIVQFGLLAGIMLLANGMRRSIPFFRKSLMPTAVLAGFIVLILKASGLVGFDNSFMEAITYHAIAIGFIAMSLQLPDRAKSGGRGSLVGAKSGALIVSTYLVQGLVGLVISIALAYTLCPGFFKAAGILLPMGYGQGPGQANNVGYTYEKLGFTGGQSFALSIAAVGFLVACVVGVFYLNILKRRGHITRRSPEIVSGSVTIDDFQSRGEIPISESVDRLSVQMAMVLLVYLCTYLLTWGIDSLLQAAAPGLAASLSPILWGFNFILGSLLAFACRSGLRLLSKTGLMKQQYPNNYLLGRISGCAFDFMVITGIASIEFADLSGLWLPFLLLCVVGGVVTFVYLQWICRKLYGEYFYEGFLSMFGMLTGTISSGVLLLREIDPDFETPASNNLLLGSSFGIVFGIPMLLFIGLAPDSDTMLFVTLGCLAAYLALLVVFMLRVRPRQKPPAAAPEPPAPGE